MRAGLLVVVLVALSLAPVASAGTISVTTTVDQLDGSAPCSLREAVNTANQDVDSGGCTDANPAAADTIKLAPGDYNLERPGIDDGNAVGDLDVFGSLTIAGVGAAESGIDGNGAITGDRVLQAFAGTLTILGLTVHGGSSTNGAPGGGIAAPGGEPLVLINSTVSGNNAHGPGGGIYTPGPATLTNSTVNFNDSASIGGGGIYAGTATLTNSTVSGNSYNSGPGGPGGPGGGIFAAGTATLTNSTVSGNNVAGAGSAGGGIYANTARLTNSTVSGNHADAVGGGVFAPTATLTNSTVSGNDSNTGGGIYGTGTLTGSTVSGNKASGRGGGIYGAGSLTDSTIRGNEAGLEGGGIDTESGSLTVSHSTVADNDSINNGGGIFFTSPGTLNVIDSTLSGNESAAWGGALSTDEGTTNLQSATINRNVADSDLAGFAGSGGGLDRFGTAAVRIRNTILAGNIDRSASPKNPDWNCNGGVVSQGYNLLSSTAGCTVAPASGDQTAAPALAPLADNGGKTLTKALLSSSPAINTGNPAMPGSGGNACPSTDQRGVPRSLGGRCDKGAYERVSCHGTLVNRVGTGGADTLVGTSAADGMLALGGNDVLRGGSGGDGLCGGDGNDQLFGEAGPDFLDGGAGTDGCDGGTESDQAVSCETRSSIP
jgi:CSLREA domain-containing protein